MRKNEYYGGYCDNRLIVDTEDGMMYGLYTSKKKCREQFEDVRKVQIVETSARCEWKADRPDVSMFDTGCGNRVLITIVSKEAKLLRPNFCPHCGLPIKSSKEKK